MRSRADFYKVNISSVLPGKPINKRKLAASSSVNCQKCHPFLADLKALDDPRGGALPLESHMGMCSLQDPPFHTDF